MGNYKGSGIYPAVVDRVCSCIDCAGWDESLPADPDQRSGQLLQRLPLDRIRRRGDDRLGRVARRSAAELCGHRRTQNLAVKKYTMTRH